MADQPVLTAAIRRAVRGSRQFGDIVILNAPAGLAEQLRGLGLTGPWVMDAGGRVAWPLTDAGLALRTRLLDSPARRATLARCSEVARAMVRDMSGLNGPPPWRTGGCA